MIKVNSHCIVAPADDDDPVAQEWKGILVQVMRFHAGAASPHDYVHVESLTEGARRQRMVFRVKDLRPA